MTALISSLKSWHAPAILLTCDVPDVQSQRQNLCLQYSKHTLLASEGLAKTTCKSWLRRHLIQRVSYLASPAEREG